MALKTVVLNILVSYKCFLLLKNWKKPQYRSHVYYLVTLKVKASSTKHTCSKTSPP